MTATTVEEKMEKQQEGVQREPVVVIDNYDSFTYNLVQYLGELGTEPQVFRNDATTLEQLEALSPGHIVISPGPCTPREAGISNEVIARFAGRVPVLGVCLGHQCIGSVFGAKVVRAERLMHGKTSQIYHDGKTIYSSLPQPFEATRYHSLVLHPDTIPDELDVSSWTEQGEIMGVRHRRFAVEGVQFHPESVLTTVGKDLLKNFLALREVSGQT
jgi:anthranilate synthase/aminodeoxychorismate synthase-like glutamine amidotransferase